MRLLVTVVGGGVARDLSVDAPDDACVRDLARALAPTGPVPALHLGEDVLGADQLLRGGVIRHGAVIGVGSPLAPAPAAGHWEVRVESGPGAGLACRLDPGEYLLGPGPECDVLLEQAPTTLTLLVRRDGVEVTGPAAPLTASADAPGCPVLVDDGVHAGPPVISSAATPLVHLDRQPVEDLTRWPPGRLLRLGPLLLGLAPVRPVGPGVAPEAHPEAHPESQPDVHVDAGPESGPGSSAEPGTVRHHPAPRLLPPAGSTRFALPAAPAEPEQQPWPWLMLLVPLAIGGVLYLVTHAWQTLIFLAMSPLLALGSAATGRRTSRRRHRRAMLAYTSECARSRRAALVACREEAAERRARSPDPASLLSLATTRSPRLWARRRDDPDALLVRLGTADQLSPVRLTDPARPGDQGDEQWLVPDLPVTFDLTGAGVLGIAGPQRHRIADWLLAQLACQHSPADVRLAALEHTPQRHDWLCWLPHVVPGPDLPGPLVGVDDLRRLLAQRIGAPGAPASGSGDRERAWVVVLVDGRPPDALSELLTRGPSAGIVVVCLAERAQDLPRACDAVLAPGTGAGSQLVLSRHEQPDLGPVRPDLVVETWAPLVARALAPVRDAGRDVDVLPGACSLLAVAALRADAASVRARWHDRRTTAAVIGLGAEGRAITVDLTRDGPHALVAGTTGSGKSELLQTLVASLAATYPPHELAFVLVDYKGGAAFRTCAELPHTVGMVTDLDAHLTARALASLSAEVRRREAVLAAVGAVDLAEHETRRGEGPTLPRLVIVVDEFATLAADLPDFVTGLIDIARRGRSLGVHLVLATQRPAGVVTADIRANTSLRIVLRVTDPADSADVIERPDAARISDATPGRGLLRRGPAAAEPFQTARVTGPRPSAGAGVVIAAFPPRRWDRSAARGAVTPVSGETDLDALVAAITVVTEEAGVDRPASPWLPPLADLVEMSELVAAFPEVVEAGQDPLPRIPFGVLDEPDRQRRALALLDLGRGRHLSVVGAPGSGRTQVLRTLAGAVGRWTSPDDVHLHVVDCGGGALLALAALAHTGVVVTRDQTHRMQRLLDRLAAVVRERQELLANGGFADVGAQRRARPDARLPWVLVLLDRWESFCQVYDDLDGGRLVQAWQHLLQEAGSVGITVVMTGDRSLRIGRMCTLFEDTVLLRSTDPGDLAGVGVPRARVPERPPPGRGFRAPGGVECQVAVLDLPTAGPRPAGLDLSTDRILPFHLDDLPRSIGREAALGLVPLSTAPRDGLLLAVGGDRLAGRHLSPTTHGAGFLVAGPRRSGRSTALLALGAAALTRGMPVVAVTPRASSLASYGGLRVVGPGDVAAALVELGADDSLVLVDDLELLDPDGAPARALTEHLARIRDSGSMLAAAGNPADLATLYRGPAVALRRAGTGLLLSPRSSADADLLGVRLPRSALSTRTPPGRGHLVVDATSELVQVVLVGEEPPGPDPGPDLSRR